jgi:hypothetical protein
VVSWVGVLAVLDAGFARVVAGEVALVRPPQVLKLYTGWREHGPSVGRGGGKSNDPVPRIMASHDAESMNLRWSAV